MTMGRFLQAIRADRRGAAALEFALVAPVLLGFIFLLIEGGRMEWTKQVVQEVTTNTARCMALGTTSCGTSSAIQAYARARGLARGVSLATATITVAANQTCQSVTGMNKVTISLPYHGVTGLLPLAPSALATSACYPSIS